MRLSARAVLDCLLDSATYGLHWMGLRHDPYRARDVVRAAQPIGVVRRQRGLNYHYTIDKAPENMAARAWRTLWPVLVDPSPDVVVAMPLLCAARDIFGATSYSEAELSQATYRVVWVGWSPLQGILVCETDWQAYRQAPPHPGPGTHWSRFDSAESILRRIHESRDMTHERAIYSDRKDAYYALSCLPMPRSMPGLRRLIGQDRLGLYDIYSLMNLNYKQFLSSMPPDTAALLDVLSAQGEFEYNGYHERYVGKRYWNLRWGWLSGRAPTASLCAALDYLVGGNPAPGVDIETARFRRIQFNTNHPLFAGLAMHRLYHDIDAGLPSVSSIERELRCKPRVVKALLRVGPGLAEEGKTLMTRAGCIPLLEGMTDAVLADLSSLDSGCWRTFSTIAHHNATQAYAGCERWGGTMGAGYRGTQEAKVADAGDIGIRHLGAGIGQGKLDWLCQRPDAWNHLDDLAFKLDQELVVPAFVVWTRGLGTLLVPDDIGVRVATGVLFSAGVRKLLGALDADIRGLVHNGILGSRAAQDCSQWMRAIPDLQTPGGATLRTLVSQAELDHESERMSHCVATYGSRCQQRHCVIMSLGMWSLDPLPQWLPSSTMELSLDHLDRVCIHQHLGLKNSRPSLPDQRDADWFIHKLHSGQLMLEPDCLFNAEQIKAMATRGMGLEFQLGQLWRTPQAHALRWDRWRRLLDTRAQSFGQYLAGLSPGAQACIPSYAKLVSCVCDVDALMARGGPDGPGDQSPEPAL